jgi:hypothetical protein
MYSADPTTFPLCGVRSVNTGFPSVGGVRDTYKVALSGPDAAGLFAVDTDATATLRVI